MKVILSRKGFDSKAGGHASPILPSGEMLSLPIPSSLDSVGYEELQAPGRRNIKQIIDDLDAGAGIVGKGAHADPELIRGMRPRQLNWRHSLGQIGSASGHLRNEDVGAGDLFLFYGWFRHTELVEDRLQFRRDLPGFHAIYGYLEIDEIITARDKEDLPRWLHDHPHAVEARLAQPTNAIYVARPTLSRETTLAGAGVFCLRGELVLTKPGLSRSRWALDTAVFRHLKITYHNGTAWKDGYFQSYARGQEYVVHADDSAVDWAYDLISGSEIWDL